MSTFRASSCDVATYPAWPYKCQELINDYLITFVFGNSIPFVFIYVFLTKLHNGSRRNMHNVIETSSKLCFFL